MKYRVLGLSLVTIAALGLSGCSFLKSTWSHGPTVRGSGVMKTVTLPFKSADIKALDLGGAIRVEADPTIQDVTFETDDNLVSSMKFTLVRGVLRSEQTQGSISLTKALLKLSPEALESIQLSGACSGHIKGLDRKNLFKVELSGATKLEVEGFTQDLSVTASGASQFSSSPQKNAYVQLVASGASSIVVPGTMSGSANASGASKIRLGKAIGKISTSSTGASSIQEDRDTTQSP